MNAERQIVVNITNRTIVRTILWIGAAFLLFQFVEQISRPLTLIFIAFFLAMALNPVVNWVSRRLGIKGRAKAVAVSYLLVILALAGFFAIIIPPLVVQTRDFIVDIPLTVENFQRQDNSLSRAVERYNLDERLSMGASDFASQYSNFGNAILSTGKRVVGTIVSVIAVLVMTFMMLVEGPKWLNAFWRTVPTTKREHRKQLAFRMYKGVTGFVNGQVVLALLAGISSFLVLTIAGHALGEPINALALAGIVAVFALIPLFGNLISASLVTIICLLSSIPLGLIVLAYFIIYQQIENVSLQPYIQSRLNELTPLTVFVAALIGIGFAGILGAIIAIPAASAAKIILEDQFARRGIAAK